MQNPEHESIILEHEGDLTRLTIPQKRLWLQVIFLFALLCLPAFGILTGLASLIVAFTVSIFAVIVVLFWMMLTVGVAL